MAFLILTWHLLVFLFILIVNRRELIKKTTALRKANGRFTATFIKSAKAELLELNSPEL